NVAANQTLPPAEAASLHFDPVATFVGTASFTYRATDNSSLQSNVANYSIPVTNLPPVANPILSPALNRTDPSRPIPDLAGFDGDGTIVSYTIVNVPVAADGVLSYRIGGNGTLTPVTAGQTLTTAEAASLEFDPATSAGSFVNFSYRANDNNGQTSQPATYTIPMRQYIPPVVQDVRFNRTLAKDGSAAAPTPTSYIPTSASWATSAATIAVINLQDPIASDADGTIARYEILTLPDRSANGEGRLRFPCNSVCQAALPTGTLFTQFCDVNGNTSATAGSGFTSGNDGCLPTTARYRVNSDDPNYVEIVKTDIPIPLTFAQMEGLQFNPRNPADGKVVNFSYTAVDNDGYVGNTARYFIPISSTSVSTPPYALDKQGALIQNTAVLATVATLEAYDNADVGTPAGNPGTINRYQIETVPTPAEGTLFLNGNPVIAGQTIAVADAGNLKFTPNVNFAGVASFTYIAFDNDQVVSGQTQKNSNVAVVRIPVTTLSLPDAAAQYTTMPNTNAATAIPSLAVSISGGGTLSPFVVHNVPTAAQGVLTYNNGTADVPVVVGGPITLAQASTLKFDPAPGFVGNFVLTYSASTFEGVFSNPAAFTIRVTDPPPAALDVVAPAIVKVSPGIATSLSGSPLVGTDNTTITEYRISSIPSAASGTLSVCSPTCVPVVAGQTLTPTQAAQLSFTPAPGFTGTAAVFNYEAIDNNSQKSNVATYTIPLSEPEINITATPVCIKDVPYMNYTVTSNFNLTGRTADITWITGTPQALPPTSPVSPIVNQVVLNSQPLTVGGGGFSATGQVIWAGAAKNANDEGIDWPAWVFSGGQWLNQEDGFSGYRTNPTFRVTINPSAEVSAVGYPPSSPLCLTEPPIAVTGTVWKDADGSGKINVNNIQTGTEAGTNATPNTGSQVLYANAIARGKNGNPDLVIETAIVQPDGTYEFNQIQRQYLTTDYDFEVVLSTTQGTIGSSIIPGAGAPNQWETTVAQRPIASSNANIFNLDLGAQQLPETDAKVQNINGNLTVGQPYLLDDSPLTGSDPEDGLKGPGNTFRISSLPVGANLYYNGVLITQADVTAGTGTAIITNYNPALLDIRFTTTSLASRVFTYAAIDLANGVDPTPANYTVNPPSVLPATGLSLTGTLSSSQVNLVWTTVTEANTSYFVVERSADGSRFSSLGNVTAAGNSTAMRSYHFEDKQLQQSQLWYYRIKLVDLNGEVKYSNVVSIRISANAGSLVVYPNPVESRFYVTLPAIGRYKLDLVNAQGQQVWTKQV
ncbi:MAG TPA: hypothetical protein PKD90_05030, partial [Phnomibacter sp.]|nr:hypothetical protein [Phnomibacter sp.]